MECRVCGEDDEWPICDECEGQGFTVGAKGEVVCPTCGGDFTLCGCSAPDSAIM
jgi:hypothetical protein